MEKLHTVSEIKISYNPKVTDRPKINTSWLAFDYLSQFYPLETIQLKEYFVVMYMNRRSQVLGGYRLSEGGLSATIADVRLILGIALKIAAHSIILSHNHPSGELTPSDSDISLTRRIKEACELMDLKLLDHLIIGSPTTCYSFSDEGIL